jgi:hypothetical protein
MYFRKINPDIDRYLSMHKSAPQLTILIMWYAMRSTNSITILSPLVTFLLRLLVIFLDSESNAHRFSPVWRERLIVGPIGSPPVWRETDRGSPLVSPSVAPLVYPLALTLRPHLTEGHGKISSRPIKSSPGPSSPAYLSLWPVRQSLMGKGQVQMILNSKISLKFFSLFNFILRLVKRWEKFWTNTKI